VSDLLALARLQLEVPGAHSNRIGCWLARSALEDVIDQLLAARSVEPGAEASTRSRLTCLEVAYQEQPDLPARAGYAWSRLSEACHQHAYQLSPTYSEARHLLDLVETFVTRESEEQV
jgi:hypothetical protein